MRILVVDDDQNGLLMLEAMLKGFGYEVVTAENGETALELARVTPPELIISDILMPVMDGYELCREWKRDSKLENIPFIFYTATYTDSKDEELALSLGADRFIVKPVEPDELDKILQEIFGGVEKGRIKPKKPALQEEKEIFKLYNERLVKKLEKKMLDLEREIVTRKRAEEALYVSALLWKTTFDAINERVLYHWPRYRLSLYEYINLDEKGVHYEKGKQKQDKSRDHQAGIHAVFGGCRGLARHTRASWRL